MLEGKLIRVLAIFKNDGPINDEPNPANEKVIISPIKPNASINQIPIMNEVPASTPPNFTILLILNRLRKEVMDTLPNIINNVKHKNGSGAQVAEMPPSSFAKIVDQSPIENSSIIPKINPKLIIQSKLNFLKSLRMDLLTRSCLLEGIKVSLRFNITKMEST